MNYLTHLLLRIYVVETMLLHFFKVRLPRCVLSTINRIINFGLKQLNYIIYIILYNNRALLD
jgi:hypothetical protein